MTITAPARMKSDCATMANAAALFVSIPAEVRTIAPAPAWVAAPAGDR